MLYEEIRDKKLRHKYLYDRYKELVDSFAKENDKLDILLPPLSLTNDRLAKWYGNVENKTKLHNQFELIKKLREELNQVYREYLASLKESE